MTQEDQKILAAFVSWWTRLTSVKQQEIIEECKARTQGGPR